MEDGATVAVCLSMGGKDHIPEAIGAFQALRYDRVKAAQKTGETTRDLWHKADYKEMKRNPESMRLVREAWLLDHDAEKYAEENYAATVSALKAAETAPPIQPTARVGALIV